MQLQEWYMLHFPEITNIFAEREQILDFILKIGRRPGDEATDVEDNNLEIRDIITSQWPDLDTSVMGKLEVALGSSVGVKVTTEDINHIQNTAAHIKQLLDHRTEIQNYLKERMMSIAPNLTHMVGEVIGARLLTHAGSMISLSRAPASTVQLYGAEKALFRALKSRDKTPKYGIIYQTSLLGEIGPDLKPKIARTFAAKISLCARIDAHRMSLKKSVPDTSFAKSALASISLRIEALKNSKVCKMQKVKVKARRLSKPEPAMKKARK